MHVTIICVSTLCGRIEPMGIGSPDDRKRLEQARSFTHASMIGASSLRNSDPEMRCENGIIPETRIRAVITESGSIPANRKIFQNGPSPLIFTSADGSSNIPEGIRKKAHIHILRHHSDGSLAIAHAISILEGMGAETMLIEGGGRLNYAALKQGVADELMLTLAPRITGVYGTTSLVDGPAFLGSPFLELELLGCDPAPQGSELFLKYRILKEHVDQRTWKNRK